MSLADVITALELPAGAHVDQRVPKKLLVENGAPTAADKRRINEGIEEVRWVAALKPTTIGVPEFRDPTREYLEIAVLSAVLRPGAPATRISELIHRAVPYPVCLVAAQGDGLELSLAHKRWSLGEVGRTVVDGAIFIANVGVQSDARIAEAFANAMALSRQPRHDLRALYQGWIDTVAALLAARVTGSFVTPESAGHADALRSALAECARLEAQIASVRGAAAKETQLSRRVELNLKLKRLQQEYSVARSQL